MSVTAQEFATQVAATFGMVPARVGREWRVCCPAHEADGGVHKPSLAVWDRAPGRVAFKCMTGCSQATVRADLKARGVALPGGGRMTTEQMHAAAAAEDRARREALVRIWYLLYGARVIQPHLAAGRYLESRNLHMPDSFHRTLWDAVDPLHPGDPCLLGTIIDLTTYHLEKPRVVGIQTLSLNADGAPALTDGKKLRSNVGQLSGFGVPYGMPGPHLLVAEGIESMLAGMQLTGIPFGVATLSASNMPSLAVPEYVTKITVAADNDTPGLEAASRLSSQMRELGVRCEIARWGDLRDGWDAADELKKRSLLL